MRFQNRSEAGRILASMLHKYAVRKDLLVLALPRGGVPVAFEVAAALNAPLELFLVRKLGVPGHEELAMGAIASGGVVVLNADVIRNLAIPRPVIEDVVVRERVELERREQAYRGGRPYPDISNRCVILVDDGMATGSTMRAAVRAVTSRLPRMTIVAVPVAPPAACEELRQDVDEVVCALAPPSLSAVSLWYEEFSQTSDEEVRQLYETGARRFDRFHTNPG